MSRKKMQKDLFEASEMQTYLDRLPRAEPGAPQPSSGKGILPFRLEASPDGSQVTGRAGLSLAAEAMRAYGVDKLVESHMKVKKRNRGFTEAEMVESIVLLQLAGGEHMQDVDILREDQALSRLLDHGFPSADAIRDFLVAHHEEKWIEAARQAAEQAGEKSYVPEESTALAGLREVFEGFVGRAADPSLGTCATLDHDATVIYSDKQSARYHYKKDGKGYQPSAMVWQEQDLVVADEFRDGNVPAGKDNLRLIQRGFLSLPSWVTEYRFRSDTACYEEEVLKWLADENRANGPRGKIGFTISADMTVELRRQCEAVGEPGGPGDHPRWAILDDTRSDETVEWAEVEFTPGHWPKGAWPLRYPVLRFRKRQGKLFADGSAVKYLGIVTNREGACEELIRWHWKKAGSIEHVHDETKNGLGAGVLPCDEFGANAAWYRLSLLSYNVATVVRRYALPPHEQTARVKRLRFLLFNTVATLSTHARSLIARVSQRVLGRVQWLVARQRLVAARKALAHLPAG